jgi:lipopolysaccharide transport system permease protein
VHWQIILAPVCVLLTLINGLGLGLYFATINVKYRDIKFIVPVLIQFGMYFTPVIFSSDYYLQRLPNWLHFLFCCNPMVAAIDGFKFCLFAEPITYNPIYFFVSIVSSFIFLFIGVNYFYKFEKNFVDYI